MAYFNPEYEAALRERWQRIKRERWAVYGAHNDSRPDWEIVENHQHFEVWTWDMCHDATGRLLFNTSWLGRWREPIRPPEFAWCFSDDELAALRRVPLPDDETGRRGPAREG